MAIATGFGKAIRAWPDLQANQGSERVPLAGPAVDRWQCWLTVPVNSKAPSGLLFPLRSATGDYGGVT